MIALIKFDYDGLRTFESLDREAYENIRRLIPQLNLSEWAEDAEKPYTYQISGNKFVIDLAVEGQLLSSHEIQYTVCNFKNTYKASTHTSPMGGEQHLHVHIPNIGLLVIDEVQVFEDSCTDKLQGALDEGWRIVAVCPPNGARRPDYILGRTKATP